MTKTKLILILAAALLSAMPAVAKSVAVHQSPAVAAQTPSDVVKNFYAQLVATMKDGDELGYSGRFKRMSPAVEEAYNMPLMTRLAVGPGWSDATPEEQQQLITAFSDFSTANYAARFKTFNGEIFEVLDEKPVGDNGVMVETKLTPSNHAPVALNYLMKKDDKGNYRVVDVFLDGAISELATRRAEFGAIVKRDGVAALVNSLSTKSKEMGPT